MLTKDKMIDLSNQKSFAIDINDGELLKAAAVCF